MFLKEFFEIVNFDKNQQTTTKVFKYPACKQGSHRPGKVLEFDLGPGKLEFEKSAFCPGIVLEFCKIILEKMNLSLKNIKYNWSF